MVGGPHGHQTAHRYCLNGLRARLDLLVDVHVPISERGPVRGALGPLGQPLGVVGGVDLRWRCVVVSGHYGHQTARRHCSNGQSARSDL